jgi:hypothetical protein
VPELRILPDALKTEDLLAIKCKIKPNKPTALQEAYLEEIKKREGIAIVAYWLDDVTDIC